MNQEYKIGDQVIVYKVGTVTKAEYNKILKKVQYTVDFEEEGRPLLDGHYGQAFVTGEVLTLPSDQVLRQSEIDALNDRGIRA